MTQKPICDAVGETLFITVCARATQSAQPNPIITDPDAVRLMSVLPYDFRHFINKPSTSVGVAIRAKYFDEQARQFIIKHPDGVIVNVGCGLDTRLQRLGALADHVPFYGVDIDEVIDFRRQWLPPLANEMLIKASMFESSWLDMLAQKHSNQPILFIAEGVMMYFDVEQNQRFMRNIADRIKHAVLFFDCPNVRFSRQSKRHSTVKYTKAKFRFGMNDPTTPETWDNRWHHVEHRYFGDFTETWQMGLMMGFLMNYVPLFKKSFFMVGFSTHLDDSQTKTAKA